MYWKCGRIHDVQESDSSHSWQYWLFIYVIYIYVCAIAFIMTFIYCRLFSFFFISKTPIEFIPFFSCMSHNQLMLAFEWNVNKSICLFSRAQDQSPLIWIRLLLTLFSLNFSWTSICWTRWCLLLST